MNQSLSLPPSFPTLISLSYLSTLLSSSPLTSPASPLPPLTPLGYTSSSSIDPITATITTLPPPSSALLYTSSLYGQRGALITSAPYTLPSLGVYVRTVGGGEGAQFAFAVASSSHESGNATVQWNVSAVSGYAAPEWVTATVSLGALQATPSLQSPLWPSPSLLSSVSLLAAAPTSATLLWRLVAPPTLGTLWVVDAAMISALNTLSDGGPPLERFHLLPTVGPPRPAGRAIRGVVVQSGQRQSVD